MAAFSPLDERALCEHFVSTTALRARYVRRR